MFGRFRRDVVLRGGGVRIVRGTRKPRFKKGGHYSRMDGCRMIY